MTPDCQQFRQRVQRLVSDVEQWVASEDWEATIYPKRMRDVDRQMYEIPALYLQKGPLRVLLDPVAYDIPGSEGLVDIYLMPTYDDVASLYFEEGEWRLHYTFPPDPFETHSAVETQVLPAGPESFLRVLESIAAHAEPTV